MPKFERIGLGGTFDRLHTGHELILDLASYYSESIQIGLISEEHLHQKPKIFGDHIQAYHDRANALISYCESRNKACSIIKIDTIGKDRQLASKGDLQALLVSQETYSGAAAINHDREVLKKPPLIIILSAIVTTSKGKKLSSSNIRENLFNKE